MSTPEQPDSPALTRKQMREIRNTGSNPIITADREDDPSPSAAAPEPAPAAAVPLARAAEPIVVAEPPVPDAAVDLGVSPLTRRQARQQERIRTASVPVITPEIAAAYTAAAEHPSAAAPMTAVPAVVPSDARPDTAVRDLFGLPATDGVPVVRTPAPAPDPWAPEGSADDGYGDSPADDDERTSEATAAAAQREVNPLFGAGLLAGAGPQEDLPPSFDQLLGRSTSGTGGTPHALIVSETSSMGPIVAPVNATGEVLITGTFNLPEGLASNGHAPGAADGKEIDASLVDGEIPAHSSPTPIAASAAISTVKSPGEIIKPPAPEKGSKLMMTLAITAGVLALALVGVLILAFVTGVF
jgi:hypothetical protein